jgi:hypothetical protein
MKSHDEIAHQPLENRSRLIMTVTGSVCIALEEQTLNAKWCRVLTRGSRRSHSRGEQRACLDVAVV